MLASDVASLDGVRRSEPNKWGWFHGVPSVTPARIRLNIETSKRSRKAPTITAVPTACMPVDADIVPDSTMSYAVLVGRSSRTHFVGRTYRDIGDDEITGTIVGPVGDYASKSRV